MPHVITLTGPSGAGISTTVFNVLGMKSNTFNPVLIPKFTTRKKHDDHGEVMYAEVIPSECDLVYIQYGAAYGLNFQTILEPISKGQSPIVILNDVRAVEDVRNRFGCLVKSVFIFREKPTLEGYRKLAKFKGEIDKNEAEQRYYKALAIFRIYIENIPLFDHVILNSGTLLDLKIQAQQIVHGLTNNPKWSLLIDKETI